ncbi:MAG: ABC transporter permease subunit [Steroidobacteraceae bacterium]|jgi:peptide/nickel transport system permease protein
MTDWRHTWYRLSRSPLTVVGLGIVIAVLLVMIFAPLLSPYDPNRLSLAVRLAPPSLHHWFGTDEVGRDLLSRVIWGSRASVVAGIATVAISMSIGTLIGAFSGLSAGWVDTAIMRTMDILLAFPSFILAMTLAAALGPSLINAIIPIAIVRTPFYVRLARGQALTLRDRAYVRAAVSFGSSTWHIVRRHILPNSLAPIVVQSTLDIGLAILTVSALSFIGLGAQQPTAEWGAMVANGRAFFLDQWWYPTFPGLAILVTAVGYNLLGDGLREILDPRLRGR